MRRLLRWLRFVRVSYVSPLGTTDFYLWRYGWRYRRLHREFNIPLTQHGPSEAPRNFRAAEIRCHSTQRTNAKAGGADPAAAKPDPAKTKR